MVQSNLDKKKLPTISYEQFIKIHKSQLALIPKIYWLSLYNKLTNNIFDIHKNIQIETKQITYSDKIKKQISAKVCNKNGLKQDDGQNIFLIRMSYFLASY